MSYNKALLLSMCSRIKGASVINNLQELDEDQLKQIIRENCNMKFRELPILAMKWVVKNGAIFVSSKFPESKQFIDPGNIIIGITQDEEMCLIEDLKNKSNIQRKNVYVLSAMNILKDLFGKSLEKLQESATSLMPKININVETNLPQTTSLESLNMTQIDESKAFKDIGVDNENKSKEPEAIPVQEVQMHKEQEVVVTEVELHDALQAAEVPSETDSDSLSTDDLSDLSDDIFEDGPCSPKPKFKKETTKKRISSVSSETRDVKNSKELTTTVDYLEIPQTDV